ncbi:MAG: serine protein kinase RIO [Thermoproteota archaeon]|nr:serine protein kinase RIO [Candidatus Brockarchaeota archaeon]
MSEAFKKFERKSEKQEKAQRIKIKRSEEYEYLEGVFDKITLLTIYKLLNDEVFSELNGVISTGKESKVFHAIAKDGKELAVKIYFTGNLEFKKSIRKYIEGDPRFSGVKRKINSLIEEWARKEYINLESYSEVGVRVPKPVTVRRNVLVMEFIGKDGVSAPLLKEAVIEDPQKIYKKLIEYIRIGFLKAKLVHGDLSEYNILMLEQEPVIIDVSQAVDVSHPLAIEFLQRDIKNINRFFRQFGVSVYEEDKLLKELVNA